MCFIIINPRKHIYQWSISQLCLWGKCFSGLVWGGFLSKQVCRWALSPLRDYLPLSCWTERILTGCLSAFTFDNLLIISAPLRMSLLVQELLLSPTAGKQKAPSPPWKPFSSLWRPTVCTEIVILLKRASLWKINAFSKFRLFLQKKKQKKKRKRNVLFTHLVDLQGGTFLFILSF